MCGSLEGSGPVFEIEIRKSCPVSRKNTVFVHPNPYLGFLDWVGRLHPLFAIILILENWVESLQIRKSRVSVHTQHFECQRCYPVCSNFEAFTNCEHGLAKVCRK